MGHEIARHWRLKAQRYSLVGEKCENGHFVFPPRDICPNCGDEAKEPYTFSGKGKIYSLTTIYEAPTGYEKSVPYVVALVELDEGPRITAQLTDLPTHIETKIIDNEEREILVFDAKIDDKVEMVTRKQKEDGDRGLIIYGYKFRPSFATEASMSSK